MTSPPTLTQRRDAEFAQLEDTARAAIRSGAALVLVDPAALLGAMATLGAYRDMAGLGDRIPRRRPADPAPARPRQVGQCVRCGLAWRTGVPGEWMTTYGTPTDCEHTTGDGAT